MRFYPAHKPPPNICIMRIDSDPDEHILLSIAVAELGVEYDKICIDSGEDALHYLEKAKVLPDYIIVHYELPGMSGIEFIRAFKTIDCLKVIPVILFSPHLSRAEYLEAKQAGMDCFIERFPNVKLIKQQIIYYAPFYPSC